MPLTATWVGRESIERIADIRMRCYGHTPAERDAFIKRSQNDRFVDGDVVILSDDTGDVATATSLSLSINVRGTPLPCQGVAWVGTVRSHRRRKIDGRGLASRVMDAMADKARERKQAVSMLAPFRVSFYESFGYGVVERQNAWTIPTAILPQEDASGFDEYRDADFAAALASRQRQFRQTHGDVATDETGLRHWLGALGPLGFRMIDRQGDAIASQFTLVTEYDGEQGTAVARNPYWDSIAALKRLLSMLGTLKDQYSLAKINLPADLPINWWLRERQIPHRRVDHPAARCQTITRMQAKVLDVPTFVAALRPTGGASGVLSVNVNGATWRIELADGRATAASSSGTADVSFDEPTWAAVAFGDLPVATAALLGRIDVNQQQALATLTDLVAGPVPYCHEYF